MKKTLGIFVFGLIFTAVLLFSSTGAEAYTHVSTLRLGVNSGQVLSLQQALNNAGFIVSSSGAGSAGKETTYFGVRTKTAVIAFQKSKGLVADGIVGAKSGLALASSIVSNYPDGCTSNEGFSKTTGAPCHGGLDIGLIPKTCPNNPTAAPLSPTIQIISPNGGQTWKTGETHEIKWLACNMPDDSWVKLTYTYTIPAVTNVYPPRPSPQTVECIATEIPPSPGLYSWKIKDYINSCSDALSPLSPYESFQTKIKAELYTGTPACEGLVPGDDPCVTGTRTLHASDESNTNFVITN
jgi:peptidoglycan hydrolase-like protein with peptidoglycan-binding domain